MSTTQRLLAVGSRTLIALLLASGLWLVVNAEESVSGWVRVRVEITLDADYALSAEPPIVHALVTGKRRELLALFSNPPTMQRAITVEANDSTRLELRVQDVELPLATDLVVRDIRPRLLLLSLRRSTPAAVALP